MCNKIGIYKICNIKTNKNYIGSSKDIDKRFKEHIRMLENNCHHSSKLQRSYNATKDKTVFQFLIIEIVDDIELLKEREQHYIDMYDSFNNGYNCSEKVDNPKYCLKNQSKTKNKIELDLLYKKFFEIYNNDYIILGNKLLKRLKDKQYKNITVSKIINSIVWFNENYDKTKYRLFIKYHSNECWLLINDNNKNCFATYRYVDKIYYYKKATEYSIEELIKSNKYDCNIHIPIITDLVFDK